MLLFEIYSISQIKSRLIVAVSQSFIIKFVYLLDLL
jgi:hypothetical protein